MCHRNEVYSLMFCRSCKTQRKIFNSSLSYFQGIWFFLYLTLHCHPKAMSQKNISTMYITQQHGNIFANLWMTRCCQIQRIFWQHETWNTTQLIFDIIHNKTHQFTDDKDDDSFTTKKQIIELVLSSVKYI